LTPVGEPDAFELTVEHARVGDVFESGPLAPDVPEWRLDVCLVGRRAGPADVPASGSPKTLRQSDPPMQEASRSLWRVKNLPYVKCLDKSGQ